MIWLHAKENLEEAQKFGFGMSKDKCKKIGHVRIPQLDYEDSMMYYLCFNCAKEVHKWPLPKNLPPTLPATDYKLYQDQIDPYNKTGTKNKHG